MYFHVSFYVSFHVSFTESCNVSFNVSLRASFNVSLRVSFNVSFHVSFDLHEVHTVFIRAMPRFQGVVAHDCVKLLVPPIQSMYFGKCMAFLQDSDDKQFVVIQWFTRHEANGFDMISNVPSFKLAPEAHTKSYSTLPLQAILNGALMVPGGGLRYWAVLSPREHKLYTRCFQ